MNKSTDALVSILLGLFILSVPCALAEAWTMRQFYSWFLAERYGAGPTLAEWYGIATIMGVLIARSVVVVTKTEPEEGAITVWMLKQTGKYLLYLALALLMVSFVRLVLGWR